MVGARVIGRASAANAIQINTLAYHMPLMPSSRHQILAVRFSWSPLSSVPFFLTFALHFSVPHLQQHQGQDQLAMKVNFHLIQQPDRVEYFIVPSINTTIKRVRERIAEQYEVDESSFNMYYNDNKVRARQTTGSTANSCLCTSSSWHVIKRKTNTWRCL
jgi:hypothetical protein